MKITDSPVKIKGKSKLEKPDCNHSELRSERIILRPLRETDLARLVSVAGLQAIADTTISVPNPFTTEDGRVWIEASVRGWISGEAYAFAVVIDESLEKFVGYIALRDVNLEHSQAELSFCSSSRTPRA
jgi:RimJ/RimL family protein N-acetyltransferase